MVYNIKTVAQKINSYFSGEISKEQLSRWAKEAYEDLLLGGFLCTEKLCTYFFLKKLSIFDVPPNVKKGEYSCLHSEISEIKSILSGSINKIYKVAINLNRKILNTQGAKVFCAKKEEQYQRLKTIMLDLDAGGALSDMNKIYIKDILSYQPLQSKSLPDLIEFYISALLSDPDIELLDLPYAHERGLCLENKIDKHELFSKILMFIDYYLGVKPFRVCISFLAGNPSIVII